jgi:hypothetical protein
MTIDLSFNPRVAAMLGRIEELTRRQGAAGPDRRIATLYMEVGQYVHWLLRQDPASEARIAEEGRHWAAELDGRLRRPGISDPLAVVPARMENLPTPLWEADGPGGLESSTESSRISVRLERSDDAPPGVAGALVEIVPDELIEPVSVSVDALGELVEVEPLTDFEEVTDSIGATATSPDEHAWMSSLRDLLDMLGAPERGALTEAQCQSAANRLLNATTQMEVRWVGYPDATQTSLCGFVATRCRALQQRMPVDVELRMALGRLRRFHSARKLPVVGALDDSSRPEAASWDVDADRYWSSLRRGG